MTEKIEKELVTLKGKLKMGPVSGISVNNDNFYKVPLEIMETRKNGQEIDNQLESIMLMFWMKENKFDSKTQEIISNLKENDVITVHGFITGQDNGLFNVMGLETEEEGDIFI
jgi:hypothetical protein